MIINNVNFNDFLQNRGKRQYSEKTKDYHYYLFKVAYDEDCDFIQIMRVYNYNNPNGKPSLKDKSELGGIYIYSLGLLFNIEYDMWNFLASFSQLENEPPSVKDYYKRLCKDISAEIIRRVETGQFDRADAKKLIADDDSEIQYIYEYRQCDSVERTFLEGVLLNKPDICITYDTQCEYNIEAVLRYLHCPADIISERATLFMQENKARIYKQIIRAEIQFEQWQKLEVDKSHPLHYKRELQSIMRTACVKTVNVTFERDGKSVTVKMQADRLGWNDYVSDWDIVAADRYTYNKIFDRRLGGDAQIINITLITHGKKELYNKSSFEKQLKEVR